MTERVRRASGARRATLTLLLLIAALAAAPPASAAPQRSSAGPILSAADANDLASSLADAQSTQGVCYGWDIHVDDNSGGQSGTDAGSSKDPNSSSPAMQCARYVVLEGSADYTCDSCEANDSASYDLVSNLPNPPTTQDLDQLGVGPQVLLTDNNDTGLINSVQALPLLVAERGNARYIKADLTPKPASSPDHATNPPSSVSVGEIVLFVIGALLVLVGLLWLLLELRGHRRRRLQDGAPPEGGAPGAGTSAEAF